MTPPFTKGRKQLSRCEIDWSCEHMHVERVIKLQGQDTSSSYHFLADLCAIPYV